MKALLSSTALTGLLLVAPFAAAAPETDEQRLAYSLGVTLGESMQADIEDLAILMHSPTVCAMSSMATSWR